MLSEGWHFPITPSEKQILQSASPSLTFCRYALVSGFICLLAEQVEDLPLLLAAPQTFLNLAQNTETFTMARNLQHWLIVRMDYLHRIVSLLLHPHMIFHGHIWQLTAHANVERRVRLWRMSSHHEWFIALQIPDWNKLHRTSWLANDSCQIPLIPPCWIRQFFDGVLAA